MEPAGPLDKMLAGGSKRVDRRVRRCDRGQKRCANWARERREELARCLRREAEVAIENDFRDTGGRGHGPPIRLYPSGEPYGPTSASSTAGDGGPYAGRPSCARPR